MSKIVALTPPPSRNPNPGAAKPPWVDIYDHKVGQRICDLIASGQTLAAICREAWAPKARVIHLWFADFPEFRQDYEAAYKIAADHLAREIVALADEAKTDLEMARLPFQISSRTWLAQRMDPARYGDRKQIEQNVTSNIRSMSVTKIDMSRLSSDEILIAEKALRKALQGPDEVGIEDDDDYAGGVIRGG
jgi:hypothetical protein